MRTARLLASALAVTTLAACDPKGACVLPGGTSEVCFWQTESTCLATPPATTGERPPLFLRGRTCPEAGFRCVGTGFATGNRRVQADGTCPARSEGPF